ncbi:MAG TPA: GRP family sugar transporter [Gemmatimonadaceae bacterium]|nr:GRP family sugar transporter [Gemmatimonadaceae bacterium]
MSAVVAGEQARDVPASAIDARRLRTLQTVGMICGLTAGAWLGAAEAPTKLVNSGLSPVVVSLAMVVGVFLARWSLPALIQGTSYIAADLRQAPHLIVWAVLAGSLWAVANTLTIFAVRDVGLSIAFPLWNSNSLLGILWGILFFGELRGADARRWFGVIGGALLMFGGATALAIASSAQSSSVDALRGVAAALAAGVMWGTMYIPYRKAYLTGMNPLSFITFFTVGELAMMSVLAISFSGGVAPLLHQLSAARHVLFWLLAGGVVWVVGDLFQQYAVKYAGITRGIPLSNTNQLWGLLWGILVFGELRGGPHDVLVKVILGSVVMASGAGVIALSSVSRAEHARWREAALREGERYGVDAAYTEARGAGREPGTTTFRRSWIDWLVVAAATATLVGFATIAEAPQIAVHWGWAAVLAAATLAVLAGCAIALWRTTRFS